MGTNPCAFSHGNSKIVIRVLAISGLRRSSRESRLYCGSLRNEQREREIDKKERKIKYESWIMRHPTGTVPNVLLKLHRG